MSEEREQQKISVQLEIKTIYTSKIPNIDKEKMTRIRKANNTYSLNNFVSAIIKYEMNAKST